MVTLTKKEMEVLGDAIDDYIIQVEDIYPVASKAKAVHSSCETI